MATLKSRQRPKANQWTRKVFRFAASNSSKFFESETLFIEEISPRMRRDEWNLFQVDTKKNRTGKQKLKSFWKNNSTKIFEVFKQLCGVIYISTLSTEIPKCTYSYNIRTYFFDASILFLTVPLVFFFHEMVSKTDLSPGKNTQVRVHLGTSLESELKIFNLFVPTPHPPTPSTDTYSGREVNLTPDMDSSREFFPTFKVLFHSIQSGNLISLTIQHRKRRIRQFCL